MKCLRLCLNGVFKTANRQTILLAQIPSNKEPRYLSNIIKSLVQRRWSHICWSFSLILKGESKFYLNGNEIGTQIVDTTDMVAAVFGREEVHDAAFIFGQEPDVMKGAFDRNEAFLGDLAQFNMWNTTLENKRIRQMASCKTTSKGTVVSLM